MTAGGAAFTAIPICCESGSTLFEFNVQNIQLLLTVTTRGARNSSLRLADTRNVKRVVNCGTKRCEPTGSHYGHLSDTFTKRERVYTQADSCCCIPRVYVVIN